jgi:hypothetical protein
MMLTFTQDKYMRLIQAGHDTVDKLAATGLRRTDISRSLKLLREKGAIDAGEPIRVLVSDYVVKGRFPPKTTNAKGVASKPQSDRVYEAKERKCLCCRADFVSEWEGNRVCPSCKSSDGWHGQSRDHSVVGLNARI